MAEKNRDPHIVALEAVHAALKDLDAPGRKKVLSSVFALLDVEALPQQQLRQSGQSSVFDERVSPSTASRPLSLVELIQQKQPGTSAQRIALFAYYREKVEGFPRFSRDEKPYFPKAKEPPAANYDRDFVEAVRKGWIHEDGLDSYLTSKGIEAIESGFEGERKYAKGRKPLRTAKSSEKRKPTSRSRTYVKRNR